LRILDCRSPGKANQVHAGRKAALCVYTEESARKAMHIKLEESTEVGSHTHIEPK